MKSKLNYSIIAFIFVATIVALFILLEPSVFNLTLIMALPAVICIVVFSLLQKKRNKATIKQSEPFVPTFKTTLPDEVLDFNQKSNNIAKLVNQNLK